MSDLDDLITRVRKRRQELDRAIGEAKSISLSTKAAADEVSSLHEEIDVLGRTASLLTSIGEDRQELLQRRVEELVTWGLQSIFDESLSFHIVQSVKGKSSTVEFLVRTTDGDSVIDTPVMDARGGGLAAIVGFLLRIVVLLLRTNDSGKSILVLDETFAHVSEDYLPELGAFLKELVDKTGVQIVMVTHQPEFTDYADIVYKFSMPKTQTKVVKL